MFVSDTHSQHFQMPWPVPNGDILVHAGDFTRTGRPKQIEDFNQWLATMPHQHKV